MKLPLALIAVVLVATVHAAEPPELEQLRANYKATVSRVNRPLMQAYITQLERQRDSFARATKLDAANAVQAEIKEIKQALTTLDAAQAAPPKAAAQTSASIAAAPTSQANLLANPSFVNGQTGWEFASFGHHGTATVDTSEAHEGRNCIRIENSSDDDGFLKQTVSVKPLTRYRFTGHIKTKDVGPATTPHSGATLSSTAALSIPSRLPAPRVGRRCLSSSTPGTLTASRLDLVSGSAPRRVLHGSMTSRWWRSVQRVNANERSA